MRCMLLVTTRSNNCMYLTEIFDAVQLLATLGFPAGQHLSAEARMHSFAFRLLHLPSSVATGIGGAVAALENCPTHLPLATCHPTVFNVPCLDVAHLERDQYDNTQPREGDPSQAQEHDKRGGKKVLKWHHHGSGLLLTEELCFYRLTVLQRKLDC